MKKNLLIPHEFLNFFDSKWPKIATFFGGINWSYLGPGNTHAFSPFAEYVSPEDGSCSEM